MLYGMRPSFSDSIYFMLPKTVCILLKILFRVSFAFWGYFIILLLVFHKAWLPNGVLHWKWIPGCLISIFVTAYQPQRIMNVRLYCTTFYRVFQWRFMFLCAPPMRQMTTVEQSAWNKGTVLVIRTRKRFKILVYF